MKIPAAEMKMRKDLCVDNVLTFVKMKGITRDQIREAFRRLNRILLEEGK